MLAGTTTFSTNSATYSGDINIMGGNAVVNALLPGDAYVGGTGMISGDGTINSLNVLHGGTVAPGNSPGTLNVVGGVVFAAGTTYAVEVAGAQSDLILAGGAATLNGGTVLVTGVPSLSQYAIVTAAGGVTGHFDTLSSSSAFLDYSLEYDPNNAYLIVDRNSFTIAARSRNQTAVAQALDQFPADDPLVAAIIVQDLAGGEQALKALTGEVHASIGTVLADDNRYVRDAMLGRLIQIQPSSQPVVYTASAPTEGPVIGNLGYWVRAFGAWGQFDPDDGVASVDRDLRGVVTGADGRIGGGWRAGFLTGFMQTDLSAGEGTFSTADINSYVVGGYAGGPLGDGFALRSGATWIWNDIDSSRLVVFPGFQEEQNADYSGSTGQIFGELAYPVLVSSVLVEPFAGLAFVHVSTDGFTESGPIAGLTSSGSDMNLGYGTLGARAATTLDWDGMAVTPHASLAWRYTFGDTALGQTLAFASSGIEMGIEGVPMSRSSALVEVGLDAALSSDTTLGISYLGQYSSDFSDTGVRGRFHWRF